MQQASGTFEVEVKPISGENDTSARMSIAKTFAGDLMGTSTGQMMHGGNPATESRVYVAIETIAGTLNGKKGSFIAVHRGTMTKQGQDLAIIIAPDSGTEALTGISGTMDIQVEDGKHSYTISYNLPES